jgi:hypothetical protein
LEETGYAAANVRLLGRVSPNPAVQGNWSYSCLAEGCRFTGSRNLDPFEDIEVKLFAMEDIPTMIRQEEICNSMVINSFALLWMEERGKAEGNKQKGEGGRGKAEKQILPSAM